MSEYTIDPNKVSMHDIETMRQEEEIFEKWRHILTEVMTASVNNEHNYNDRSKELRELFQARDREFRELLDQVGGKGVLAQIRDSGHEIAFSTFAGFLSGALVGAIAHTKLALVLGGINASMPPLLKMFGKFYKSATDRFVRVSLRNHFLSIGMR